MTNTEHFSAQNNSLECSERCVGGQAHAQAVDIDDLVVRKAAHAVNMKKLSAYKQDMNFNF